MSGFWKGQGLDSVPEKVVRVKRKIVFKFKIGGRMEFGDGNLNWLG